MATVAIAGYGGVATDLGAEVLNWNVDVTVEALDASYMMASGDNKGWREFISALQGATGSAELQGDTAPTTGSSSGVKLEVKSGTGSFIEGDIIVTRVATNVPVDGKVTWSIDFNFTGAVTATASA